MEDFEYPSTQDMIKELLGIMLDESVVEDYTVNGTYVYYNTCLRSEAKYLVEGIHYKDRVHLYDIADRFIELLRFYDEEKIN